MTRVVTLGGMFIPTGTYNDHYAHAFNMTLNDSSPIDAMLQTTRNGQNITPGALAGMAGSILRPDATPGALIDMANGWDNRRYRFHLSLAIKSSTGNICDRTKFLTGYTDHCDMSLGGNVDPEMKVYINNSVELSTREESYGQGGSYSKPTVSENCQLLVKPNTSQNYTGALNGAATGSFAMRPEDVFSRMSALEVDRYHNTHTMDLGSTLITNTVRKNNRKYCDSSHYLSTTLNGYKKAALEYGMSEDRNTESVTDIAISMVSAPDFYGDIVLDMINQRTMFRQRGYVTMRELSDCFPDMMSKTNFLSGRGNGAVRPTHNRGDSCNWHDRTLESHAATMLSNSVPAIMADLPLTRVRFHAQNLTMDGTARLTFDNDFPAASYIQDLNLDPYLELFTNRMISTVLNDVSQRNQIPYQITMDVDLIGETVITISMDRQPDQCFVQASFCDSLTTPVVTDSYERMDEVALGVFNLAGKFNDRF